MSKPGPIFIIGSGPLIGSHVARLFATKSFSKVALVARSTANLSQNASFIKSAASSATVKTYTADVTDSPSLTAALNSAVADLGAPEIVIYNAARIKYGSIGEYSTEDIITDFKIPNLGLYNTVQVLLPGLQKLAKENPEAHPSLFVTSGQIVYEPLPPVFSLSMAKAAQASLVKLLAAENKDMVHVALVTIGGPVSEDEKENNPNAIAETFWKLYSQERGAWEGEAKHGW